MVNRVYLQCNSCNTGITCRTQFGVGREQTYLFPCPDCQVDVGFTLILDQKNLTWRYGDFVNLRHYEGEGEPEKVLNFSSDFLVSKDFDKGLRQSPLTPQFENISLSRNMGEFYTIRNIRRKVTEDFWPRLHRAETHRKRNYRDKFDIELSAIDAGAVIDSFPTGTMAEILAEGFEKFEACFSSSLESSRELVAERIQKAREVDPVAVELLREFYAQEDRADHLYQQLRSIDKQWVELYSFFEPLEIVDCLEDPTKKLSDDYTLSEKPLERLKALYSDCFETAGRILVLAGSYEGIIRGHGVGVPSRRRLVPPAEFERTPNGSKPDLVSSMPFWQILAGSFDSKLRNGIGHHSWRYEAVTDTIHYENHSPSRGREDFSMPYLDFCLHVRRMFHAVTICSRYVHSVWLPNN